MADVGGDASRLALVRALVPKIPLILSTAVYNTFSLTPQSKKWDNRTAVITTIIRSFLAADPPWPISRQQAFSLQDPGIKPNTWISRTKLDVRLQDAQRLRQEVWRVIDALGVYNSGIAEKDMPDVLPVEAEWTGNRQNRTGKITGTEAERYENLMKDVGSNVTILYFHGGAYYMMDPSTHRITTRLLSHLTSGRALSVRYRLAPQHPFPAPLLDALVAYLSLLSPAPSSPHSPTPASQIVFAGDSAGGGLALSLLQLLLHLNRQYTTLPFNGQTFSPIPLPAGVAVHSPWIDLSQSLPSCAQNLDWDYLPPPHDSHLHEIPGCKVWPPPTGVRNSVITPSVESMAHPLASPVLCAAGAWSGLGPTKVFLLVGEELLTDESLVVGRAVERDNPGGEVVRVSLYEGRPHCFAMLDPGGKFARRAMGEWAEFMRGAVDGRAQEMGARRVKVPGEEVETMRIEDMIGVDMGEVRELIMARLAHLKRREEDWVREQREQLVRAKL
ncbi:MAG: hypothetical protein M1814_000668 [Vezdaea aestivalis]|nr:MAG: hypothetical protein M1814_000668 [Vezdaea aestivalis]